MNFLKYLLNNQRGFFGNIAANVISDFTDAQHDHSDAANGGDLGDVTTGVLTCVKDTGGTYDNTTVAAVFGDTTAGQADSVYIQGECINAGYGYDQVGASLFVNYRGYQGGTTRTRNFNVADGTGNNCLVVSGASKSTTFYGNILSSGTISMSISSDQDTTHILGKVRIGYNGATADAAVFAHIDHMDGTNFALRQNSAGLTALNSATGQPLRFQINNGVIASVTSSGLNVSDGVLTVRSDTDTVHEIGSVKIGYNGTHSDSAVLSHFDYMNGTDYAFRQFSTGETRVNAPTGQNISFSINNSNISLVTATGQRLPGTGKYINFGSTDGSSGYGIRDNSGVMEYKDSGGSWTSFVSLSDIRLKTNIKNYNLGLDFILDLQPKEFNLNGSTEISHGLIAQDVKAILDKNNFEFSGWGEYKDLRKTQVLNYALFIIPLINSVKGLQKQINELKKIIEKTV